MADVLVGAGPCVGGWVKGVLDGDDIRSAHWTVTPIIPIHHQPGVLIGLVLLLRSFASEE